MQQAATAANLIISVASLVTNWLALDPYRTDWIHFVGEIITRNPPDSKFASLLPRFSTCEICYRKFCYRGTFRGTLKKKSLCRCAASSKIRPTRGRDVRGSDDESCSRLEPPSRPSSFFRFAFRRNRYNKLYICEKKNIKGKNKEN